MFNKTSAAVIMSNDIFAQNNLINLTAKLNKSFKTESDDKFYDFKKTPGMLYVSVHAVQVGMNTNGDYFSEQELKKSYGTFVGKGNFVNHKSNDVEAKRGKIINARYIDDGKKKYVECILEVDADAYPELASGIRKGYIDSVSMGCVVQKSICSVCGNVATNTSEYCECIKKHKGSVFRGKKAYEINNDVTFEELSWVSTPADVDAKVLEVLARRAMFEMAIRRTANKYN